MHVKVMCRLLQSFSYFHELSAKYILDLENCYSLKVSGHTEECWYILSVCIWCIQGGWSSV